MYRKLGVLTFGALSLFGCGSDTGTPSNSIPGAGGGFGMQLPGGGGAVAGPGAGGMAMVVPGGGGNVVGPTGNGGSIVGNGGTGIAGSMQLGVGGGMPMGAGGTGNAGAPGGGGMPMGGAAGEGAGGAAGGGGMGGAPFKPPCLKKPSEVVFLGDSYVNYIIAHPELNGLVAQRAVMDGALMTGQNYRDYAVAGATMAATSANMIPPSGRRQRPTPTSRPSL